MEPQNNSTEDPASSWPPPVYAEAVEPENTSGMKTTVPVEVSSIRWNWGAFLGGPVWAMFNGLIYYFWRFLGLGAVGGILAVGAFGSFDSLVYVLPIEILICLTIDLWIRCQLATKGTSESWQRLYRPKGVQGFLNEQAVWSRAMVVITSVLTLLIVRFIYGLVLGIQSIIRAFAHLGS